MALTYFGPFWKTSGQKTPPLQFASAEAAGFADYLESLDLKVPRLAIVLEFERAVLATLIDDQSRIVTFDFDPLRLLRALAEGRLPNITGRPGKFEIEVTANNVTNITGFSMDSIEQTVPCH